MKQLFAIFAYKSDRPVDKAAPDTYQKFGYRELLFVEGKIHSLKQAEDRLKELNVQEQEVPPFYDYIVLPYYK